MEYEIRECAYCYFDDTGRASALIEWLSAIPEKSLVGSSPAESLALLILLHTARLALVTSPVSTVIASTSYKCTENSQVSVRALQTLPPSR